LNDKRLLQQHLQWRKYDTSVPREIGGQPPAFGYDRQALQHMARMAVQYHRTIASTYNIVWRVLVHITRCLAAIGLTFAALVAQGQSNTSAKGPDPTNENIQAAGTFAVTTQAVERGNGFGGGTIFVPTAPGTYAVVAFCPGFTSTRSSIQALSSRLASFGFVVIAMDTNSPFDFPPSRGTQLLAALQRVVSLNTGPVAGKVDPARRVVAGSSMGGGGTLYASLANPTLKAAIGFVPFSFDQIFNTSVPQLILGAQNDNVAPVVLHSIPFFFGLPIPTPKVLVSITGAEHGFPSAAVPNQPASKFQIAWAKRFADDDVRYQPFVNTAAVQAELAAGRLSLFATESLPF
jgi:dienelactone hydrolase